MAHYPNEYQVLTIYGGVSIYTQESALRAGVDILIGTTGRILDLLNRGILNLSSLQTIVLDESDVMLNMGFQEDIEKVITLFRFLAMLRNKERPQNIKFNAYCSQQHSQNG